jgi:tetratricopeptide (TPR) repeat protein
VPRSGPPADRFELLPDPGQARNLDELVERLRALKVWAGNPSYEWITGRVNAAWAAAGRPAGEIASKSTVAHCFRPDRRRVNIDLVVAVVAALHPDVGYVAQWRQALQVVGDRIRAAAQVRVQDTLPPDLAGFTGRTAHLDQLHRALQKGTAGSGAVVISAIAGMAGVGKTQLAIHAGHLLVRDQMVDRVLFVNLRGFHPDPAQPPADPAAVLDGFLRLLGVPGTQIPHDLPARTAVYRDRLAGTRTLIVLDNAATEDQVRPLLPDTPGCPVLVTSRRSLTDLHPATQLGVDVFTEEEALRFLTKAAPQALVADSPPAAARIARSCGYLPLALSLVAAHIRDTPNWTLTDHADRLDERYRQNRIDGGLELALNLSYQQLPADRRRLLRLVALHPAQDFDTYAAAALADADLPATRTHLHDLCRDHLLQPAVPDRYTLHDLVRGYATARISDEDPPPQRRAALTRLFDCYLATAAAAMDILHPAEAHRRPRIPAPGTPMPGLADPDAARTWLDTERPTLVAVAAHTATGGWPTHTSRLSTILNRYLGGGHFTDALTVHGHALHAAEHTNDRTGQGDALTNLGDAHLWLGQYGPATRAFWKALQLFRQTSDPRGQARALGNLGNIQVRRGRYRQAVDHYGQALTLFRQSGDRAGEVDSLHNLGIVEERLGRHGSAADHYEQALTLCREAGDRTGEAWTLNNLGVVEGRLDRYDSAAGNLRQALSLFRHFGDRSGEAATLDSLGALYIRLDQPAQAAAHYQQALAIVRETGEPQGEACALNGLGEVAHSVNHPAEAIVHHAAALTIATNTGDRDQQARAHTSLGHAYGSLGNSARARHHYQHALVLYTDLGTPEADQIRAHLATADDRGLSSN